jgi:hypothetical protein
VLVHRERDLTSAVDAADSGPLDRDAPATEGDLTGLMAVAHRYPASVVAALRTDDLGDLLLHQLSQHPEPDTDGQRHEPFPRGADEHAERLLDFRRQRNLARGRRGDYGFQHGGSSLDLGRSLRTLAAANGRNGGTAA